MTILIYATVFSKLMNARLWTEGPNTPYLYSIYLCSGILAWNFFSEVITRSVGTFLENAHLIKKLKFPVIALHLSLGFTALINFMVSLVLFGLFMVFARHFPSTAGMLALAVPTVLLLFVLAGALGYVLSVLNVFFRDVQQVVPIAMQLLFWSTPIVYTQNLLPEFLIDIFSWNPLVPVVVALQDIFAFGRVPNMVSLMYPAALAVVLLALAFLMHARLLAELVDEL